MIAHYRTSLRRTVLALLLLVTCVWGLRPAEAEITPGKYDTRIAGIVTQLMTKQHLTRHVLDIEIAERTITSFVKSLDPLKLYFYQSDIDEFTTRRRELLAQFERGNNIDVGYAVFKRFLQRVDERVGFAEEFLKVEHDFSLDETIVSDPDAATYAKTVDQARDQWRRRIKYDLLVLKADKTSTEDAKSRLSRRYQGFAKRMKQTGSDELLEMFLTAQTTAYDPHSTYMSPSSLENFEIQMRLELDGIGALLQFEDGYTVIAKIIPGGAADKDGRLKPKDRLVQVSNAAGEMIETLDMKLNDVVQHIRGKAGTVVRLTVQPAGSVEKKEYQITRAKIELSDSEARGEIVERGAEGRTYKVGIIDLPSFYMDMEGARLNKPDYKSTTRDVAKLLEDFKSKGVDAVVLDLRRNGGGSLTEAISLTGLFIDEGPVVQVKDKDGRTQTYNDPERGVTWDGPLVVLASKFSASASEIFAGAVQDYGRGLIIGDKQTHGKGTVQTLLDLSRNLFPNLPNAPSFGALKITLQQFYRPNGESTQNRGVQSDLQWPSLTNELDVAESDLDFALPFDKIRAVPYQKLSMIDEDLVKRLTALSVARQQTSPDFDKVKRSIARYHEQKGRKATTLNEKKFLEERAEMNADKETEKKFEELNNGIKKDFYFNEAVDITLDYVRNIKVARATGLVNKVGGAR